MFILPDSNELIKINYIVGLVIFAGPTSNISILVNQKDDNLYFPAISVPPTESSIETAAKLLFDLTGVIARCGPDSTGFIDLILSKIHDHPDNKLNNERTIYSIYGAFLPSKVTGTWTSIQDSRFDPNMNLLISEVGRKL